jgi:Na+/proline symporter
MTFLSAAAVICLPRQFQVTVVENLDERHLATASWMFPLYLFGMSLFIMPIALVGLKFLPAGANPDLFVLTLPLHQGRHDLALLAFLGGFSSAASMVIVAAIAVSTMVSNHVVMSIALSLLTAGREVAVDVRWLLLTSRRVSIALILGLLYFRLSGGSDALAVIGLTAFAGVAQFLPSLIGGSTGAAPPAPGRWRASPPAPCSGSIRCSCRASAAARWSAPRSWPKAPGASRRCACRRSSA